MKRLLFMIPAILIFSFSVSCSDSGTPKSPETPVANDVNYNGTQYEITSLSVWYWGSERYIDIQFGTDGLLVFSFDGLGSPLVVSNQYPIGSWTTIDDTDFYSIYLDLEGSTTSITSASTYTADLTISGFIGTDITINGEFTFKDMDTCSWNYAGSYTYAED